MAEKNNVITLVESYEDIIANTETIDKYLTSDDFDERKFAQTLIKKGCCLLRIVKNNEPKFYPSRFIGYKDNSISKHKSNNHKDGRITNPKICSILHSKLIEDSRIECEYIKFCNSIGCTPDNRKHTFWI